MVAWLAKDYKSCPTNSRGLTLIEVLIALAIIAIAMTAVIKATAQNIRSSSYLEDKMVATWVAQTVIHSIKADLIRLPNNGSEENTLTMLDKEWFYTAKEEKTSNDHISRLSVQVFRSATQDAPITTLESYRYDAPTKRR